ncbi:MAG: HNH endonuclease [Armatimonadetes bacterium]|nr:MAG: HNH endonuclease [Armatimonadota bacterium]
MTILRHRSSSSRNALTHCRPACCYVLGAASSMVRTARTLVTMPAVAEAALVGAITPDGIRLLTRAKRRHPLEFDHHEAVFADIAQYLTTKDLRVAIEHWEQQVDYPSAVVKVKHQRQRRRFSICQTWEGMWHFSGELDPETGSLVDTAIRSIVDRENLQASRDGSDDDRYPWQRRADALGDLCTFWLTNSDQIGTSGGSKPHITVTTSLETLVGLKEELPTIDGLVFDPDEMQRITCDSGVIRMILNAQGEPLDVGRRSRTFTPAIRRALDQRDGGCRWDGCDAPPSWCDAHHLTHWANGGQTSLNNMTLLCRTHHRATHQNPQQTLIPP